MVHWGPVPLGSMFFFFLREVRHPKLGIDMIFAEILEVDLGGGDVGRVIHARYVVMKIIFKVLQFFIPLHILHLKRMTWPLILSKRTFCSSWFLVLCMESSNNSLFMFLNKRCNTKQDIMNVSRRIEEYGNRR